jgi:DNA-binding transcriptional LysR family regulator
MADIEGLKAFVEVVGTGGFSRAARKLGVSKSIVSRRVAALEADIGVRLLSRTTRGVSLTDAGIELNKRAVQILGALDAALDAVAGRDDVVAGTLRISAPLSFGIVHLAGALAAFAARHPHVQLDVAYSDRFVDLVSEGFDAAVRIGELKDSSLVARRLADMHVVVVANPLYLARRGVPKAPRDLSAHDALIYTGSAHGDVWRFRQGQRPLSVRVQGRFRADNGEALRDAAIAGLGIAALPSWIVAGAMASGALVTLLDSYDCPMSGLYVVRPPGPLAPGKVRALIDFLAERFGPATHWDQAIT